MIALNDNGGGGGRYGLVESSTPRPLDRLPPHSVEAEMCVIASIMLDVSRGAIGDILTLIDEESFFQADHAILFKIVRQLYEENRPIDAMVVREELIKRQLLEEIGGIEYLAQILSSVPSAANGMQYAGIVREKATLRQLISATGEILRDAYSPHESADAVLADAERRVFAIVEGRAGRGVRDTHAIADVSIEVFEQITEGRRRGLETGFYELDAMLNGGLQPGEMVVLAGRPSMGKTALCMNIIEHVASTLFKPCAVFSQEMSRHQLVQRMFSARSGIDSQKLRGGVFSAAEMAKLLSVSADVGRMALWINDASGLTGLEFRAKARRLKRDHDVGVIVLDYMQLMETQGAENRQQGMSEISRAIKAVAKELDIPVVALSQLNRESEKRENQRPRMSDLRESGSIEQDADVVLLLHREDYYRQSEPDYTPDNLAEVIVAKNRNARTGVVKLTFFGQTTTFGNLSTQVDPF